MEHGDEAAMTFAMEADHGVRYSRLLLLKGLVDFEEAGRDVELTLIWDIGWEEVKKSITDYRIVKAEN